MPVNLITLEQLINQCTTFEGSKRELAWREFFKRYKKLIFYFIERSCNQWSLLRLKLQKRDVMDDVLSEVLFALNRDLANFKNRDSEKKFIAWLQVVCNRTTGIYLKRVFKNNISEIDIQEVPQMKKGHDDVVLWELYESVVETLREKLPPGMKYMERDINIFLLNVWFGFPPKLIVGHPCYNKLSVNSVEVIINRVKKKAIFF
jgi:hypothetical protein